MLCEFRLLAVSRIPAEHHQCNHYCGFHLQQSGLGGHRCVRATAARVPVEHLQVRLRGVHHQPVEVLQLLRVNSCDSVVVDHGPDPAGAVDPRSRQPPGHGGHWFAHSGGCTGTSYLYLWIFLYIFVYLLCATMVPNNAFMLLSCVYNSGQFRPPCPWRKRAPG